MEPHFCDICDEVFGTADEAANCCCNPLGVTSHPPDGSNEPAQADLAPEPSSQTPSEWPYKIGDRFTLDGKGYDAKLFEIQRMYDGAIVAYDLKETIGNRLATPIIYWWGKPCMAVVSFRWIYDEGLGA